MPSAFKTSATRDERSLDKDQGGHDSPDGRYLKRNDAIFRIVVAFTLFWAGAGTSFPSLDLNEQIKYMHGQRQFSFVLCAVDNPLLRAFMNVQGRHRNRG